MATNKGSYITRFRPTTPDELIGQKTAKETLKMILSTPINNRPRTYLFTGETGSGKTTSAKILADMFLPMRRSTEGKLVSDVELIEYNAAKDKSPERIAKLIDESYNITIGKKVKIIILDEVHSLTPSAQSALLVPTEDDKANTFWFFCTNQPKKLKPELISRATQIILDKVDDAGLSELHDLVREKDPKWGLNTEDDTEITSVLEDARRRAEGSPRKLLNFMEIISGKTKDQAMNLMANSAVSSVGNIEDEDAALEIAKAIKNGDYITTFRTIANLIGGDDDSADISHLSTSVVKRLGQDLLNPFYDIKGVHADYNIALSYKETLSAAIQDITGSSRVYLITEFTARCGRATAKMYRFLSKYNPNIVDQLGYENGKRLDNHGGIK